jgi:hypothetical protein
VAAEVDTMYVVPVGERLDDAVIDGSVAGESVQEYDGHRRHLSVATHREFNAVDRHER